jgi:hypothetical protein
MTLLAQAVQDTQQMGTLALVVAALGGMVSTISGTWLAVAKTKSDAKIVHLEATVKAQGEDIVECRKDRDELRDKLEALVARFLPDGVA